jgi:excisionase family DNA binding protein
MSDRTDAALGGAAAEDSVAAALAENAAAQDSLALSALLSAREAATQLGVSERTVRRAIQRGEIVASKRAGSFQITRRALEEYRQQEPGRRTLLHAATPDRRAAAQDAAAEGAAAPNTGHTAGDAVVVLRELLAEERRKSDALLEASLIWQTRALQLEQRLKELEAGSITSEPATVDVQSMAQDAIPAPLRGDRGEKASAPLEPASDAPAPGWRSWWRRIRTER